MAMTSCCCMTGLLHALCWLQVFEKLQTSVGRISTQAEQENRAREQVGLPR